MNIRIDCNNIDPSDYHPPPTKLIRFMYYKYGIIYFFVELKLNNYQYLFLLNAK